MFVFLHTRAEVANPMVVSTIRFFGSSTADLLTHFLCLVIERNDVLTEGGC